MCCRQIAPIDFKKVSGKLRAISFILLWFLSPMSTWSRPVILLLCGLMLMTVAIAVLNTLVPLWLTHDLLTTWQVGIVSSSYYTGNLAGTLLAGWLVARASANNRRHDSRLGGRPASFRLPSCPGPRQMVDRPCLAAEAWFSPPHLKKGEKRGCRPRGPLLVARFPTGSGPKQAGFSSRMDA